MGLFLHQIWRNLALHHLLTNGSSAVNGCRQNEGIFNLKPLLLAKIRIHNNASSSEKCPSAVVLSHQNPLTYLFWTVFTFKWCLICACFYIFLLTLYFKDQFSLLSSKSKLFTHHGTHAVGDVTIKVIWILLAYWQLLLVLINYILMSYSSCNHSLILNLKTVVKQQIKFSLRQKSVTVFSCMIVQRLPIC